MSELLNLGTSDFIKANVSNSKNDAVAFEVKFSKSLLISQLKNKLEILTGGCAGTMKIDLYKGDHYIASLSKDDAPLGYYIDSDGLRLHVIDIFAGFDDDTVEKFELSKDQYEKKTNTVRNFLKQNHLGKFNEEEMRQKEEKQREQAEELARRAELCVLESRCQVSVPGNPLRRGTIKYNGPLEGKSSIFIGVQYDEPLGKNNGSIGGKVYFVCPPNYGGFVSPLSVEVGDFPPEDFMGLDDEL